MGTPSFVLSGGIAAWGKGSRPRPACRRATSHPPLRPAGRSPCPPCAAAVPPPARPACGSPGNVAAGRRLRRLRPSQPPAVARGHPVRPQGQAPAGPLRGPCPRPAPRRLRRWCSGRPGPHDVGAVGPSAPPARAAALRPALPARPRLRRRPCRAALPTHSPPGVAALRGLRFGAPPTRA